MLKVDYGIVINTEKDILAANRPLYLPIGTIFLDFICASEKKVHQILCQDVNENNYMFQYERGYPSKEFDIVCFKSIKIKHVLL